VVVDFKTRFERAKTRYLEKVQRSPGKETAHRENEDGTVVGEARIEEEEDIESVDLDNLEEGHKNSPMTAKKSSGHGITPD
jgi:hypothetical protein